MPIMKTVLLEKLFLSAQLINVFKMFAVSRYGKPVSFALDDSTAAYMFFYKGKYVVYEHIISDSYHEFRDYSSACDYFQSFIENVL